MAEDTESTRRRLVDLLRREGPCTVSQLADRFACSTMCVRLHLNELEEKGFVRAVEVRQGKGRPAKAYALTPAAAALFPQRSGDLALEVLEEIEATAGREVVVRAIRARAERLLEGYVAALDGKPLEERVRILAAIRDGEGYLCEAEPGKPPGARPDLVEHHCPIADLARRYPEVCRIEAETFERALQVPVERVQHILSGDGECRYRVGPRA